MREQILIFIMGALSFIWMTLGAEISEEEKLAHAISRCVIENLESKYNLHFSGIQISGPQDKIEMMKLMFRTKCVLTKEEARKIVIESTEEYRKAINDHKEIQKYLCCFPFPIENIEISIFIYDKEGHLAISPNLSIVSSTQGQVKYQRWTPKNEWYHDKFIERESYEEALKIVNAM